MNRKVYVGAGLVSALALFAIVAAPIGAGEDDLASIRTQCQSIVTAWNHHDAAAIAAVFAEDGDMICPDGDHAQGRAEVQSSFAEDFAEGGMLEGSTIKVLKEPIRFLTENVAMSDAIVTINGVHTPEGTMVADAHIVNVWKKTGDRWWLFASRPIIKGMTPADPADE